MFSNIFISLSTVAVALTTLGIHVGSVSGEIAPGSLALQTWAVALVPRIFPNNTDTWQEALNDGTWDPNLEFTWNNRTTVKGLKALYEYFYVFSQLSVNRTEYYRMFPTAASAYINDPEGLSGIVVVSGNSTAKTRDGVVYTDGTFGGFGHIKWNEKLQKRTIVKWEESNIPPNYPNYPFNI